MWNAKLIQATRTRRDNGFGKAVIAAAVTLIVVLLLTLSARAEEKPIAVIYTEGYMDRLNAAVTEVGVAPGSEAGYEETETQGSKTEAQGSKSEMENTKTEAESLKTETGSAYSGITMTDAEARELRWVVALEAQGEGFRGECAVVEAIFNRVLSPRWPGTVHGVLSQKGQFATYKVIGSRDAWAVPGELEDDAIAEVLRAGLTVLPGAKYVYFDSMGGVNGRNHIRIGKHVFGAEK